MNITGFARFYGRAWPGPWPLQDLDRLPAGILVLPLVVGKPRQAAVMPRIRACGVRPITHHPLGDHRRPEAL